MNIPRQHLDEALRLVQLGLMQPTEAAQWLLHQELPQHASIGRSPALMTARPGSTLQSVATLQAELGPPPEAIQCDWDAQLVQLVADFQRSTGYTLGHLNTADILVDGDNRLSLSPHVLQSLRVSPTPVPIANDVPVPDCRQQDVAIPSTLPAVPTAPTALIPVPTTTQAHNRNGKHRKVKTEKRLISKHRWLRPTAVLAVVAVAIGLVFSLLPSTNLDTATVAKSKESKSQTSSIFSPTATLSEFEPTKAARDSHPSPQSSTDVITAIDSPAPTDNSTPSTEADANSANKKAKQSKASMGLDSFAGGNWASATDLLPTADFDTSRIEADTVAPIESEASVKLPPAAESPDGAAMLESDQVADAAPDSPTTQANTTTTVQLPVIPIRAIDLTAIPAVSIVAEQVQNLELRFPVETALTLVQNNQSWTVVDTKDQSGLASFVATPTELQFKWDALAATHPVAKQLATGLLTCTRLDGTKHSLFLRPQVTASAWSIDLAATDTRAAWPIAFPPPLGPTTLGIEFQMPEGVLQTWVQPHDPKQFRRSQSIAEFTLGDDKTIAIRARLEVRTGTRIMLRVRYAAQLDPSLPWQMISSSRVRSAIDQVTNQLGQALAEQTNIKAAYYKASTAEKKIIGPRRDELDSIVQQLQKLNERLTKYDRLISQLDNAAHLTMHLNVAWPESSPLTHQAIFAMSVPAP